MKKKQRVVPVVLSLLLMLTVFSACGSNDDASSVAASSKASSAEASNAASDEAPSSDPVGSQPEGAEGLPLTDEPITYKGFYVMNKAEYDYENNAVWKKLSEDTNVNFEWEGHIIGAGATEAFNLMLTSGSYPDFILMSSALTMPGGIEAAVDEGVIIDLKDLIPEHMPNYWAELSQNAQAVRDITTPAGYIPGVYQFQKELYMDAPANLMGMMLRGDWLEELNLEVPETIDEWHTVLTAFKNEKNCEFPLLIGPENGVEGSIFTSAYGISAAPVGSNYVQMFYPDENGKITYGGVEEGYQQYLETFSQWYAEGLYDRDFTTRGQKDLPGRAALAANDNAGAVAVYVAWEGMFTSAAVDPDFKLVAAPMPARTAGEKVKNSISYSKYTSDPMLITTSCAHPELLMKFMDYISYGDGFMLKTYGIEGEDYTLENGEPKLTDKILTHDFGPTDALEIYTGGYGTIKVHNGENIMKQLNSAESLEKKAVWQKTCDPVALSWQTTAEEGERLNQIMSEIGPYVTEETVKAIMSPDIAANWMSVQAEQVRKMNIDEAIEIMQGAYDRYMAQG